MGMYDIQALNDQFALPSHLVFRAGPGELATAEITNQHARAAVVLQGAHVTAFQPHGHEPVLWVSRESHYLRGKAIRGGIPVAWPWFATHPTDASKPSHGFVRIAPWAVTGTEVVSDNATQIRLGLRDSDTTRALWPHSFQLELIITVGAMLHVELVMHNPGGNPFTCGSALHTYFNIQHINEIAVLGLEDGIYVDKVDHDQLKQQQGPITFDGEVDRIYRDTTAECVIDDPGLQRQIHITKTGSRSTVVWNPWIAKAQRLPDFGDDEYTGMVCVETTNADEDVVTIAPGDEHRLRATISVTPHP